MRRRPFERLRQRAEHGAARVAERRERALLPLLRDALPPGIEAAAEEGGVRTSGRDLRRRMAIEPELRWLVREVLK